MIADALLLSQLAHSIAAVAVLAFIVAAIAVITGKARDLEMNDIDNGLRVGDYVEIHSGPMRGLVGTVYSIVIGEGGETLVEIALQGNKRIIELRRNVGKV